MVKELKEFKNFKCLEITYIVQNSLEIASGLVTTNISFR